MSDFELNGFKYPSTRYSGSKRRLLDWIWESVNHVKFSNVLDVFGGTASVSLLFKKNGKTVYYNDLLSFNQIIGKAVIENNSIKVSSEDIDFVLTQNGKLENSVIQDHFTDVYFLDDENAWLDRTVQKISQISNQYKRAILMASLFQACLAKRPFNLFHRKNLYLRKAEVERTFGNKTTWETPFPVLLKRYVSEYNAAIISSEKRSVVIGGYHALNIPHKTDLVYLDPPYFSERSARGTNYLNFYHFLEGLAEYHNWEKRINPVTRRIEALEDEQLYAFTRKSKIVDSFEKLIALFNDRIIVLSYQSGGIPSKEEILGIFTKNNKRVKVFEKEHRYALSKKKSTELLFVTEN